MKNYTVLKIQLLVFILLTAISGSFAQTNTSSGALWNVPGNWSLGHIPLPAEDVVINTNMAMNMPAGAFTFNSLTVNSGFILTIGNSATAQTIVVTNDVTTLGTGAITLGAFNATHSLTIGGTLNNAGTFNMWLAAAQICNVNLNGASITGNGVYTFNNLIIGGAVANNSTSTVNVRANLTLNSSLTCSAGTFNFNGGAQSILGTATSTFSNLTFTGGVASIKTLGGNASTLNVSGNLLVTGTTTTFTIGNTTGESKTLNVSGNVQVDLGSTMNIGAFDATHSLTIGGTLTNAGTITLGTSATRACNATLNGTAITGNGVYTFNNLVIGGTVTNNSTSTLNVRGDLTLNNTFTSTAGAISFMGAVAQNLNGTTNPTFNNLDLRNAGTAVTVGGTLTGVTVNGALTMNAAGAPSLNLGTTLSTFSVGGAFTMGGGAATIFDFGTTVAKTVTITGNLTGTTINMTGAGLAHQLILGGTTSTVANAFNTTASSGSTVEYNNAVTQTVFASLNYQFLKLSGGGTKTFSGITTVNNDLNITGAAVVVSSASALTVSGNLNNSGTGTTTWGGNANTLTLTGNLVVTNNTTFALGNIAGQTKTLNVTGNVQVDAGSTMNVGAFNNTHSLTIGGTLTNAGTFSMWTSNAPQVCNVTLNGTSITGNGAYTFNNVTINGAVANNSTSTINVRGNLTLNNTFTCSAGAVNFANNVAQTISGSSNATFVDLSFTGGAGAKTWGSNANTFSVTGNLLVNNNTIFTIGNTAGQTKTLNVTGNVQVDAGSTMNLGAVNATHTLSIGGTLTNAGTFSMWNSAAQLCDVTLNGTAITGNGAYTFNHLIVNGAVTNNSTSTLNVRGDLTLNNTINCSAGAFNFNGGVQNIIGTANATFNNLTFSGGAGAKTWGDNANTFTVSGNLLVINNTPFTIGNTAGQTKTLNVLGNVQVDGGSTMTIGAFDAIHSLTIGGTLTNAGTITLGTSATRACNATLNGTAITGNGAYTFNNLAIGGAVTNNSTSTLNVRGDLTLNNTFTSTAGAISFMGAVAQNLNGTTNPAFNNLDLRNAGTAVTVGGTLTGITVSGALNMNAAGTPSLILGTTLSTFSVGGAFTMLNVGTTFDFGTTSAKTVTITGNLATPQVINMTGAGLAHQLILGGAANATPVVFNTTAGSGSIVEYSGAAQTVFPSINYRYLKLSGSGTKTFSAGASTIDNDLDVTGTTITVSNANALSVNGNISNTGTGTTTWGGNANTLTLAGNLLVTNNTTFTLGNAQAKTLNISGNVQVDAGSTMNVGAGASTHALTIGGTLTNAGTLNLWTSNAPQFCNVTMNGPTITGNGAYTFNTLVIGVAVANTSTSTINVRGNLTLNNTLTCSAGEVNFNNTVAQTINGTSNATFNNLSFTGGAGAKTWGSNANTFSVTGDLLVNNNTTFTIGNTAGQSKVLDVTGNVQVDAGSTMNIGAFDAIHALTIGGTLINAGTLTLGASAIRACNSILNGTSITGNGAYTFNNLVIGGSVTNNSTSTVNVRGDLTLNNTFTCTAGAISFIGAVAQNMNGTTNPTFNNLDLRNTGTAVTIGGTLTGITVSGALTMNASGTPTMNLGTTLTSFSVAGAFTMAGGAGTIFNFGTTVAKTVTIGGNFTPQTITMQGAGLAHQLLLGGAINSLPAAFNTTAGSGSLVEYNGVGAQSVFASLNYIDLKVSGTGIKTLGGATTVAGVLTLSSGIVEIGNFNLTLTNSGATAISGGPFSATNMISTNGTGYLVKNAASAQDINPIGSGTYYSPMTLTSIAPNTGTYRVRAVPTALNPGYINVYWDFITSLAGKTITATFQYDPLQLNGASQTISYTPAPYTAVQNPPVSGVSSFGADSFTITGNVTATTGGYWTMGTPQIYYSYQTGNWNTPTTWTSDPSGTTQIGSTIPGYDDDVVILAGRTISLPSDITTQNLNLTINSSGFVDMSTFRFLNGLTTLSGQGTLLLASVNFPAVVTNSFVNSGGGTVEYYNPSSFTLPIAQTTYNNLNINSVGQTATQLVNLIVNGNLWVRSGTFQINDNTSARRQLTIAGNVTVNSGASIAVGNGVTNTTTNPTSIAPTAGAPFIGYYDNHSHRVVINGDFTNNGTVNFSNISFPVYNSFPPTVLGASTGFATVYFRGSTNNVLTCNGTTNFFNLVVDKGTDQTYSLTVNPSAYGNFKLFGANNAAADVTGASATNPNIKKSLWIRNGTLVLQGSTIIPSLTEGNITAALPATSDYYIPANGALNINGPDVVVLTTADDYQEVNTSYGVSGGTGLVNGVLQGGNSSLYVYGKLQVSDGYLSTRESGGIVTNGGSGQIIINGGDVDAKQFLNATASTASFQMTSGFFALRGRFQRTPVSYASITNLIDNSSTTVNTSRALNGTTTGFGTFTLNNATNIINMSGGDIWVYDVCDAAPPATAPFAFDVQSSAANRSVTGGTLTVIPTTGTNLADETNYRISSTAPLANLVINQNSGTSAVQLGSSLTVLSDVTIQSGVFDANAQNLTIGGNYTIANGTSYVATGVSANTTIFNGSGAQTFTVNTAGVLDINNLTLTKAAGVAVNFAGSQSTVNLAGNLTIALGTLNDNGKSIFVAGNVFNSGLHTGVGKISLNGSTTTQTIDGNGVFQNLELNNTNASAAPISLLNNTTINGALTFSQDKLFNISTYNLKFNATGSVVNAGALRYVQAAGNAGDGGITKVYSSTTSFVFPLGAASTSHVGVPEYTPASIGFGVAPTVYGSITVKPVGYAHPNATTLGRSLSYFWRVSSSGFTMGSATVTHGYTYSANDVIVGADISENEYVAARYFPQTSTWAKGTVSDLDIVGKVIGEPGTGSFLENVSFIDGDYTAGDDNPIDPFGTPKTFYSFATGVWGSAANWTTNPDHITYTNPGSLIPGASDIVVIGNNHTISLGTPANYLINPNTEPRSCATLIVKSGATLDVRYNPASNFGIVQSDPGGNGTIRITTAQASGSTFANPLGDFSDFNVNLGTTDLYSTNPGAGTTYWLKNGVTSYGNLLFSPRGGSNIIFPNNDVLIYGNCTVTGQNADSWLLPTWNTAYPLAPTAVVAKTITINGNLDIQGGAFIWYGNGAIAQNVVVNGNVKVCSVCAIDNWGAATNQTLTIGGSLINDGNGVINPTATQTTARVNLANVPVIFNGNTSASISNTVGTPRTIFGSVTVNKGTSQATTLTCDIAGTLTTPTNNWLTLQNGTFRYQRTDPATDFTISTSTNFTIPSSAGLYIDYSNANNRNILIANNGSDASDLLLSGKLTLVRGNLYVGPTGFPGNNNDIEYSGNTASIQVDGGNLFVNGQIRRSTATTNGALNFTQSGGAVSINGNGGTAVALSRAKLEVVNAGSEFNMSAGTLTIARGGGTTFGDLFIRPSSSSVTGGEIIFTNVVPTTLQNYSIDANTALYNLTVTGAAAQNATVSLTTNPLVLNGSLTLTNARSFFNSNNRNLTIKQDMVNNGVPGSYIFGTNLTTFSGATQNISGASVTNFYDLTVSPSLSLTVNNNFIVNRNLTIGSGSLVLNTFAVTLLSNGSFLNNGAYTDDNITGGVSLSGSGQQQISGTGSFNRLEINNAAGALLLNDITLDHDLVMTAGIFNIQSNNLILNTTSNIIGAPFSATKMIITDGVATSLGLTKFFPVIGSTTLFTYPVGVASKYTPAEYTINANGSIGYINVSPINSFQPTVIDPARVLDYYFSISSSGITGFDGSVVLNYISSDVVGTESDYVASWLQLPGIYWSKAAVGPGTDNVDESTNQIYFSYPAGSSNLNGDYTAGEDTAIPNEVPTYVSNSNGNWSDNTIWTPVGASPPCPPGGPNGYFVIIQHNVSTDVNNCFAYSTVIEGTGQLSIVAPTFGHNFGTVDGDPAQGTGTVYLENGNLPAGNFTPFLDCSGDGTLEYGGTGTYAIVINGFTTIPNLTVSGVGTRVLPNTDLTICNRLILDGPTLDNSVTNIKLTINGSMERYNTGAFVSGSGATATVSFAGSAVQTLGGATGDFTGANGFNNLEINNSSGLLIGGSGNIEVNGNLLLTDGILTTSTINSLSILNTSSSAVVPTGGSSTSYVNGPLKKQMVNGGAFVYPLGKGSVKGHTFTVTSTSTGTSLFTAEFFTPNPAVAVTAPLTNINRLEYWGVTATSPKTGKVAIAWDSQSDINGTMTQNGITDLQVAEYNSGPASWVGLASTTTGTNNFGAAQTTSSISLSATTKNYTLGSLTATRPIATLSPTGVVCGTSGIPVTFVTHTTIALTYTLSYNFNGIPQTPILVSALPFILPTPSPGTYQLTGFTYDNSTILGVVDPTIITTYAAPTTSVAGSNQSLCNATSLNLAGNSPTVGTGLWTIVSGAGGWFNTPNATNYNALFGGPPGRTYTLRWTIASGLCTSNSTVVISFPFAPVQPSAFIAAPTSVCQGSSGYVYTVPSVSGATSYIWSYSGTGATIIGSGNSVTVNFSLTATNGNMSVSAVNGCGPGVPRSVAVTTVTTPIATFSYTGSPYCQNAPNPSPTFSGGGVAGTFSSTVGLVFVSTATGEVNLAASTPGTYTISNTITSVTCGTVIASNTFTITTNGVWIGGVSNDWFDPNNWICNIIPTSIIDVVVPASAPNMPEINAGGAVCRSININNGASLAINGNNALDVYGDWSNNGSFTANSSTVTFLGTGLIGGSSATTFNHIAISSTGNVTAPNANVNVSGNWTNSGAFTPLTGTITFTGTGSIGGTSVTTFHNVSIAATGNVTAPTTNINVSGDWMNSGTFSASTGAVTFMGSGVTTITGITDFYNLTISKTSGNIQLNGAGPTTVNNILTLTNGNIVSSSSHLLALSSTSSIAGGSSNSYVSGPMSKVLTSSMFTFPLGSVSASRYRPVVIDNTSGPDTWVAEYVGASPTTGGYPHNSFNINDLGTVSGFEYWLVSNANVGVTTADLTLSYDVGSYTPPSIGTVANLRVARWNTLGLQWELPPGAVTFSQSGTDITGTSTVTQVSSFGIFTHASIDYNSPLPIKLLYFKATRGIDAIQLEWATAEETNNDYFTVEKSSNGEVFHEVVRIQSKGSDNQGHRYFTKDVNPYQGISYYRLKQTDVDGTFTRSQVVVINYLGQVSPSLNAYPNPFNGKTITVEIKGFTEILEIPIQIYNLNGIKIMEKVLMTKSGGFLTEELIFEPALQPGLYFIKAGQTWNLTMKIVVQ